MKHALRAAIETLRNLFVPSEANNSVPFLLSWTSVSALTLGALLLVWLPFHFSASQLASLVEPFTFTRAQVVNLTNQSREVAGLSALKPSTTLEAIAARKAQDIFAKQYFAHNAPDGVSPWTLLKEGGYSYRAAGENLALDFVTAEAAQEALMASPSHRANILSPLYTEIGVAVMQGMYNGRTSIVVVEYFGLPKPVPVPTAVATTPKPAPRPTSTVVTSTITIQPTTTTTVLGSTSFVSPTKLEALRYTVGQTMQEIPNRMNIQLIVFALLTLMLVAAGLLIHRTGTIPTSVAFRTIAAILIIGYTATIGMPKWSSRITPTSFATISIVE